MTIYIKIFKKNLSSSIERGYQGVPHQLRVPGFNLYSILSAICIEIFHILSANFAAICRDLPQFSAQSIDQDSSLYFRRFLPQFLSYSIIEVCERSA